MKKLLLLSLFFTSFLAFSQNPLLLDKTWYLYSLDFPNSYGYSENPFPNEGKIQFSKNDDYTRIDTSYYYFIGDSKVNFYSNNYFRIQYDYGWHVLTYTPGENQEMNQYTDLYLYDFLLSKLLSLDSGCCFSYIITDDGKKLAITDDEGNTAIFYNSLMAIKEVNKINYKLYPNPVSDILTIENLTPHSDLELIDSSGKVVKQIKNIQTLKTQINIKNLAPGIYYLKINNQSSQKIIKK